MRKTFLYCIMAISMLSACINDNEIPVRPEQNGVKAVASDFTFDVEVNDNATRTSLQWYTENKVNYLKFSWNDGDRFAVFSDAEQGLTRQMYSISAGQEGSNSAYFYGGGFELIKDKTYYSFSPFDTITNKKCVYLSYEGQCQYVNDDCSHLGAYDFQVACSNAAEGYVLLNFKHLGAAVRFQIMADKNDTEPERTYKKFELITADNYEFQYKRRLDLTDNNSNVANYNPKLTLDHTPSSESTNAFTLTLADKDHPDGITVRKGELLKLYMMVPASAELVGKNIYGVLTEKDDDDNDNNDTKYYVSWKGVEFGAGKAVSFGGYAATSDQLNISLKVDKAWQLGNTQNQTRGTTIGDPGYEDDLEKPDHIYIYTCKDGVLHNIFEIDSEDSNWADWSDNGKRWSYNQNISVDLGGIKATEGIQVYAIACKGAITRTTSVSPLQVGTGGTGESVIQAMTMTTTATEDILKNLYSYKYEISASDPQLVDAVLYHTAAKVDIQWNATTALPTTGGSRYIKVNRLPNTGLMLFTPTENTASGTWSPSAEITPATMYNGRAVFYLPQMETPTYEITIGTSTENIEFTKVVKNGWTTWFKGNVKLN